MTVVQFTGGKIEMRFSIRLSGGHIICIGGRLHDWDLDWFLFNITPSGELVRVSSIGCSMMDVDDKRQLKITGVDLI